MNDSLSGSARSTLLLAVYGKHSIFATKQPDWAHGVSYIDLSASLRAMSTKIIRRLIVAAIALQLLWSIILPAGNRLAPRSPEMAQAFRAFETNRSTATETAM